LHLFEQRRVLTLVCIEQLDLSCSVSFAFLFFNGHTDLVLSIGLCKSLTMEKA
jgi:hypothetical protein